MISNQNILIKRVIAIFFISIFAVFFVSSCEVYFLKTAVNLISRTLVFFATKTMIYVCSFITLLIITYDYINKEVNIDYLTKLYNRKRLYADLNKLIKNNDRFLLCYVDFNNFKIVNDEYGHEAGDMLLVEFSKKINEFNSEDLVGYRIGGDEFILLILNYKDNKKIIKKINEISKLDINITSIVTKRIGFSMGVVENDFNSSAKELIKKADNSMYLKKKT